MKTTSLFRGALALGLLASFSAAQSPLCTINPFASNNGGATGGAVYFDLTVNNTVIINSLDTNYGAAAGTAVGMDVYMTAAGTSYAGNEANQAAWTLMAQDDGTATSAGIDGVTTITLATPLTVTPGTYGFALVATGSSHRYTNGDGTNQNFSTAEMSISLGSATNTPFSGSPFSPRVWNGCINYQPGQGIFANFDATPTLGNAPLTVQFTDLSFSSATGGIQVWVWDFENDGTADSSLQNPSHTYPAEGIYDVSLTVFDNTGMATEVKTGFIEVDTVQASFTTSSLPGNTVQFTDTSLGNPTSWAWDFQSDGTVDSTAQNPTFAYPAPGAYDVTLTVADAISNDTTTVNIGVNILPMSPFVRTFSSAGLTRGFYFQAPVNFSITSVQVPDETMFGLQNVAIYKLGAALPAFPTTVNGEPEFFAAGVAANQTIPTAVSYEAGDWVAVLGACGDATIMHNSYGNAAHPSSVFGNPVTLLRMGTQTNIVSNSGVAPLWSENAGAISRTFCGISSATGIAYGDGSPSSSGGVAPALSTTALPLLGQTAELTYELDAADAGGQGFLNVGLSRTNLRIRVQGLRYTILTAPLGTIALGAPQAGANTFQVMLPATPALAGGVVDVQYVGLNGQGRLATSNGMEWTFAF